MSIKFSKATQIWKWGSSNSEHWAPIPIRLIVGYGFMAHGYDKLVRGPEHFVGVLHALGVPLPELMAWMTIVVELVGGLAVLMGVFVRLMSVPLAAILLVSMFTVELPYGFLSIKLLGVTSTGVQLGKPGYEVDLLYLACLTALLVGGAGKVSFDRFLSNTKNRSLPANVGPSVDQEKLQTR